jgi:hypothetical protein
VGLTPRAIRHVPQTGLVSSSGCLAGAYVQFTFLKHPYLEPQLTSSGVVPYGENLAAETGVNLHRDLAGMAPQCSSMTFYCYMQRCVIRSFGTFYTVNYAINTEYTYITTILLSSFGSADF